MQKQNQSNLSKNNKVAIVSLIVTIVAVSSFMSINLAAAETTPAYAFNGAYATYKASASELGLTVDGTITYTISNVDSNAQTFTLTPSYGGQLSVLSGLASSQTMSYSSFLAFAIPPSYMQDLNKGEASGLQYSSGTITTGVSVTVPAGTYTTDRVDYGVYSMWIDQGSGLVVKVTGTYLGLSSADIELQSTNVSSASSLSTQIILIIAAIVIVVVVVAVILVLLKKRKPKQDAATSSATDATPTSPASTNPQA
jgi:flagellar basal body-associated protein FliL